MGREVGMRNAALLVAALLISTGVQSSFARSYHSSRSTRSSHYYTNVSGHRVRRPVFSPTRPYSATAHCADGTWSFSEHARGTCSHHGGVR